MFESTRRLRLSRSGRQSEAAISCVPVGDWSSFVESLHPHEWEQLGRARSDKRRSDFVAGHHAAKLAICAQLATWLRPSSILIEPGVFGQPIVRCPESARVGVSIAHSGGCAVAVAFDVGHPMGIDIELIDRKREATLRSQAVVSEVSLCLAHRVPMLEMSTHLWCAKEAVGKAMLTGLTVPSSLLEVSSVVADHDGYRIRFRNLIQYGARAVRIGNYAVALGHPRDTELEGFDSTKALVAGVAHA
nr:4'-phosphopantetheinyl transferase superfamily protein [Propionicimonas sp.]